MGQLHETHELYELNKWYIILILDTNNTVYSFI